MKKIVPSRISPIANIMGFDRQSYVDHINSKKISKPIAAATLRIHKAGKEDVAANTQTCEDLSFNPWNGDIVHHKPLGVISRLKRRVYNTSRRMRHVLNGIKDIEH